jgi:predicted flap endonuclease-1-like 5' DNA nuclease
MGNFCSANWLWLLLPLLIGLLTGWWAWARRSGGGDYAYAAPAVTPEPVRVPDPVVAAPRVVADPAPVAAKIAEVPKPVAAAAAALTAIGIPVAIGNPDDLLQIKGVGPKLNQLMVSLGIRRFDQIAKWGAAEIGKVDEHLGSFKGRIVRDSWVEQAGLLARGAIAEFEAKFGKLDSEN